MKKVISSENPAWSEWDNYGDEEGMSTRSGWDDEVICYNLMQVLDDIYNLSYEIKHCVKGAYTGAETYSELADYISKLADDLKLEAEEIRYETD